MGLKNHPEDIYRENPFLLTYGTKAIIPAKIKCTSYRVAYQTTEGNHLGLRNNLDLLEETYLTVAIRNEAYQRRAARYHNTRVYKKIFKLGDLVLKKLEATDNTKSRGKMAIKQDGPFKIARIVKANTYHLQDTKGKHLPMHVTQII